MSDRYNEIADVLEAQAAQIRMASGEKAAPPDFCTDPACPACTSSPPDLKAPPEGKH